MKKQLSEAQLAANKANAQKSTGPKTEEGKARSSMNAYKHGITARRVVLDDENKDQFRRLLNDYRLRFSPAGGYELRVVDDLCLMHWHINRLQFMEAAALQLEMHRPEFCDGIENLHPILNPLMAFRQLVETVPNLLPTLNTQLNRLTRGYERLVNVFIKVRKEIPPIAPAEPEAEEPEQEQDAPPPQDQSPCLGNEPGDSPTLRRAILFMQKPVFKPKTLFALAA